MLVSEKQRLKLISYSYGKTLGAFISLIKHRIKKINRCSSLFLSLIELFFSFSFAERSSCLMTGVTVTPPLPPFTMTELLQHVAALHPVPSPEEVQAVLSRLPCLAASSAADEYFPHV